MSKEAMKLVLEMLQNKMYAHAEMYLTEALAKQEGQSNFCPQCEALARELKAAKQEQGEQDNYQGSDAAKAAHMMDLYTALGVKWGEDPFAVITKMRSIAETEKQERPTGPATSADRYFYDAGFEAGRLAGIKITLDEWAKSEPPVLVKQEQGEPVAWYIREKDMLTRDANWVAEYPDMCEPLYTTPQQQRKPLTDEQRRAIILKADTVGQAIAMVEAAHGIKE